MMNTILKNIKGDFFAVDISDDLCDLMNLDHFHPDELITIPLVKLNNKGYYTNNSCSGHAIYPYEYKESDKKEELKKFSKTTSRKIITIDKYKQESSHKYYCAFEGKDDYPESFICFEQNYNFDSLPKGWGQQQKRISKKYDNEIKGTELYLEICKEMVNLEKWVDGLPNNRK